MLVLTIDDDDLVRESIAVFLEDSGFDVIEAENGQQGIIAFRQHNPDVVLCDLRMPDMDGMQVLEVLTLESPKTPVIIISGAGIISNVVEALKLGAWDYLVKPIVDMSVLEQAIQSAHKNKNDDINIEDQQAEIGQLEENLIEAEWDGEELRKLQLQLLPPSPNQLNQFTVQHLFLTEQESFRFAMDVFAIGDNGLGVYLIDIGVYKDNRAFIAMMVKSFVSHAIRRHRTNSDKMIEQPANLLRYLNLECHKANLPSSLPGFYAYINRDHQQLEFCTAGLYPQPMYKNRLGELVHLAGEGMPLGMFPWTQYQQVSRSFASGDSLCFFANVDQKEDTEALLSIR